jgi:hypothetical protein
MQCGPFAELSGLVFMLWRTECYTVHFMQDSESVCIEKSKLQGKEIPLQAWTGPKGSRSLRVPDFMTIGT